MKKIFLAFFVISILFFLTSCGDSSNMEFADYGEYVNKDYFDYELDLVINSFEFYVADAELVYEYKSQEKDQLTTISDYRYRNLAIDVGSGLYKEVSKSELTQQDSNSTIWEKTNTEYIYQQSSSSDNYGSSSNAVYLVNLLTKTKRVFSSTDSIKNIYESNISTILKTSYSTYSYLLESGTTNYYYNKKSKILTLEHTSIDSYTDETRNYIYQIKYVDDNFSVKIYYEEISTDSKNTIQTSIIFHHKNIALSKVNLENYN